MKNNIIKNIEGKRLIQQTKLVYSLAIIEELKKNPELMNKVMLELGITKEEFCNALEGKIDQNITFYDQVLLTTRKINNLSFDENLQNYSDMVLFEDNISIEQSSKRGK